MNFAGPIDEFVSAMLRLSGFMKQLNSRETQARGMRELEAINGGKGESSYHKSLSIPYFMRLMHRFLYYFKRHRKACLARKVWC